MSSPPSEVEAFVRRYFERRSGPIATEDPGIYRATLPEALRPAFEGADEIRIAFSPEAAAGASRVELVAVGSYVLDRIIEDAARSGWHTVERLEATPDETARFAAQAIRPTNASLEVGSISTEPVVHLLFNFRVRLTTDERVDRFESILIDVGSRTERRTAPALFEERASLNEEGGPESVEIADAYRIACAALEARVESAVRPLREQAEALRKAEVERITSYFDRSVNEVLDSKVADGRDQIRALEGDRERRLAEAEEKYRFTGEVELCNVRTVRLDVTKADLMLSHRGARRSIPVEFDCMRVEVGPLRCEVCAAPMASPVLCFGGHLAGPECVKGCGFCDRIHCRTCIAAGAIATCSTCRRSVCTDHLEVCALSRRPYCPDDIHECAICGRTVGPEYVVRCASCEQRYCAVCVAPPADRCLTCRELQAAAPGDPAVAALRSGDPALAKVTKWRRASNQRFTVLLAKGLVWNVLLVVEPGGKIVVRKKVLGT